MSSASEIRPDPAQNLSSGELSAEERAAAPALSGAPAPAAADAQGAGDPPMVTFADLGLSAPILEGVEEQGYDTPTPIQASSIPPLLEGRDLVGQARTGTGKTAAFGLPLLQGLDLRRAEVQALVLAPTRELALQVTHALKGYGERLGGLRVLSVYGGQAIHRQLTLLERGVHVVVGTPGRVMDCMRRGALNLGGVRMLVLDEADEMLRMGFIEDVEWILSQAPGDRQTALFSATMPGPIRRVAQAFLRDPISVDQRVATRTVAEIDERVVITDEGSKLEALTRILEAEDSGAVLVFARTKVSCDELAHALKGRGFPAAALHGDLSQAQREDVLRGLRDGYLKLVIATDVAARGLDVDDITHVINFDPPGDAETYVHRVGRTGRAGRTGIAILLLTPREWRVRNGIERFTRKTLTPMRIPTNADLSRVRVRRFKAAIAESLEAPELEDFQELVAEIVEEGEVELSAVAAALAHLACQGLPLTVEGPEPRDLSRREVSPRIRGDRSVGPRGEVREDARIGEVTQLFVSMGYSGGLRPGDLVGAVTGEAGINGRDIGVIEIKEHCAFFELSAELAERVLDRMGTTTMRGRRVHIKPARPRPGGPQRPGAGRPSAGPRRAARRGPGRPQ